MSMAMSPGLAAAGPITEATAVSAKTNVVAAYYLRAQSAAVRAGAKITAPLKRIVARLFSWVPGPVAALAAPVILTTPFGYNAMWSFLTMPVALGWWAAKQLARLAHWALGHAEAALVSITSMFSTDAGCKLADHIATFSAKRVELAQNAALLVGYLGEEVMLAVDSKGARTTTMITAIAASALIAFRLLFAGTFATMLAALHPAVASPLAGIAVGGWAAVNPIVLVSVIAVAAVLALGLFTRTPELPAPVAEGTEPTTTESAEVPVTPAGEPLEGIVLETPDGGTSTVSRDEADDALKTAADTVITAHVGHKGDHNRTQKAKNS